MKLPCLVKCCVGQVPAGMFLCDIHFERMANSEFIARAASKGDHNSFATALGDWCDAWSEEGFFHVERTPLQDTEMEVL